MGNCLMSYKFRFQRDTFYLETGTPCRLARKLSGSFGSLLSGSCVGVGLVGLGDYPLGNIPRMLILLLGHGHVGF